MFKQVYKFKKTLAVMLVLLFPITTMTTAQAGLFDGIKKVVKKTVSVTNPLFWQAVAAGKIAKSNGVLRKIGVHNQHSCITKVNEVADELDSRLRIVVKVSRDEFCKQVF